MIEQIPEFSVSEISFAIKKMVETTFSQIRVRGEIFGCKRADSGHYYLSLKDENAVLFLVGEGELREDIENKIRELELQDKVILTGRRKDVIRFLQMFDLFLFPSVYEGLPVSMVEA